MIDPPRWEGLSHPEIYDVVVTRAPQFPTSVSAAAADLWAEAHALIPRIDERIARAMQRSAEGWTGTAADATRSAMTPLSQWALDSTGDAKLTLDGVELQANQAKVVRDSMPKPDMTVWSGAGEPPLSTPGSILTDQAAAEYRAAESAAHAVDLMNTYTGHSYEARSYLNYWSTPPQVTVEVAPASSPTGGGGAGVGGWGAPGAGAGAAAPVGTAGAGPAGGAGATGVGAALTPGAPAGGDGVGPPTSGATAGLPRPGGAAATARPSATAARPGAPATTRPGGATGPGTRDGGTPSGAVPGRTAPSLPSGVRQPGSDSGFRPIVPGPPPRSTPPPSWRDVVRGTLGPEPSAPPRAGGGVPGGTGAGRGPANGPGVFGEPPAAPGRGQAGGSGGPNEAVRPGSARAGSAGHPGLMPPMSGGAGGQGREHRRPSYLVDDSDAFTDDRWVTLPVIGPDDPLPPPRQ